MTKPLSLIPFCFLVVMFVGCGHSYDFWDVSKFKMDSLALRDNDAIKLLYTSRGPDNNKDQSYYIHIVAISQKTGDTVNILTTINNGFAQGDEGKTYNFFDQNNIASKIASGNYESLADNPDKKIEEIEKAPLKKISKVARDRNFDHIADNKYPTVIGTIGISMPPQ